MRANLRGHRAKPVGGLTVQVAPVMPVATGTLQYVSFPKKHGTLGSPLATTMAGSPPSVDADDHGHGHRDTSLDMGIVGTMDLQGGPSAPGDGSLGYCVWLTLIFFAIVFFANAWTFHEALATRWQVVWPASDFSPMPDLEAQPAPMPNASLGFQLSKQTHSPAVARNLLFWNALSTGDETLLSLLYNSGHGIQWEKALSRISSVTEENDGTVDTYVAFHEVAAADPAVTQHTGAILVSNPLAQLANRLRTLVTSVTVGIMLDKPVYVYTYICVSVCVCVCVCVFVSLCMPVRVDDCVFFALLHHFSVTRVHCIFFVVIGVS
jgi:hypothetical protein